MNILYKGGSAEIVEKKSRFIATVFPVRSEEEALKLLEQTKKKYWDARHNCFAYVIGEKNPVERCSDDGEPSGTAGKPMLSILKERDICNLLVVVTRYFGGTLLGTGGLVRAYSKATAEGIDQSVVLAKKSGVIYEIETDYTGHGKISYIAASMGVEIRDTEFSDLVRIITLVPDEDFGSFEKKVTEATKGQAVCSITEKVTYGTCEEGTVIFERFEA
ncbi:MAG: YigZ family protein [Lachnospiraceae bacterium]|nr:YigZ family protein [Lachnospiraceae bacterium]